MRMFISHWAVMDIEIRVKRLEEMIEFEELSEDDKKQKPGSIREDELWRELSA